MSIGEVKTELCGLSENLQNSQKVEVGGLSNNQPIPTCTVCSKQIVHEDGTPSKYG